MTNKTSPDKCPCGMPTPIGQRGFNSLIEGVCAGQGLAYSSDSIKAGQWLNLRDGVEENLSGAQM